MPYPIKIVLIDDHELIRESWKLLLEQDVRFDVIAQCSSGEEAIREAARLKPDILLMDINMSPMNGFEATEKIVKLAPSVQVIGVSANNNKRYAARLFALGGRGFITKTSAFDELKIAIEKVYNGEQYLCNELKTKPANKG